MIFGEGRQWATLSYPITGNRPGTLRSLIRASGLTVDQFIALTKNSRLFLAGDHRARRFSLNQGAPGGPRP